MLLVELTYITMHQSNLYCQARHSALLTDLTDISEGKKRGRNYHNHMKPIRSMANITTNAPPTRPLPGNYGLPLLGPLKDRLDYFWFQGQDTFFRSRMASYKSTVFRVNMPPTFPFFGSVDPRVVAVLDCKSFAALFDSTLVDKRDVLVGDFMPSVSFTGGTRVVVYQDTSEESHGRIKSFCLELLRRSAKVWVDSFIGSLDIMLSTIEGELSNGAASSNFLVPLQKCIFTFLTKSIVGADPSTDKVIAETGFALLDSWLGLQLLPIANIGLIQPLEEILFHSFPYPSILVSGPYKKLYNFVEKQGQEVLKLATSEYGLNKDDAINNILFVLGFNAFGGFSVFFPSLITTIGRDKNGLREKLREEVRRVLKSTNGEVGFEAVKQMELVKSTVYEILRLNPPVQLQYGRARNDFLLTSHDTTFQVTKGELLCGYQPLAMRDPAVFQDPESFIPTRFMGDKGKELLNYVYWSNGPQTSSPSADNKQCAAKDYVVWTACLFIAEVFRRYDNFECDDSSIAITKLEKASS